MGLGEKKGGVVSRLAYHSPGSWPISEATSLVLATREPIESVKALASL